MMPHTISDTRETPAVCARLLVLCLAVFFALGPMLAGAQDHRWQVTIKKVAQLGPSVRRTMGTGGWTLRGPNATRSPWAKPATTRPIHSGGLPD